MPPFLRLAAGLSARRVGAAGKFLLAALRSAELIFNRLRIGAFLQFAHDLLHLAVDLFPGQLGHAPHHPAHRARIVFIDVGKLALHRLHRRFHPRVVPLGCAARRLAAGVGFSALGRTGDGEIRYQFFHAKGGIVGTFRNRPALRQRFGEELINAMIIRAVKFVNRHGANS